MDKELQSAISVLMKRVDQKAQDLAEAKRLVNSLCREAGTEAPYPDVEISLNGSGVLAQIRSDQFYRKTPIVAAREYLELRGTAVPLEEILNGLVRGGFDFDGQGWSENLRLKNLGISLGKNSSIFHRLPNETIGLLKWYPEAETARQKRPLSKSQQNSQEENGNTETKEKAETASDAS